MPDPTGRVSHLPHFHRGVAWKEPCRVATTANVTIATALNAGDTIDGVTLAAGDRVLVKDQSTGNQNGIYVAGASPARAYDMDQDGTTTVPAEEVAGAFVYVIAGTANAGKVFHTTNVAGATLGSTTITWTEFSSGTVGGGGITSENDSALFPQSVITATKSASNPTLNFASLTESVVKVEDTYYSVYQTGIGGNVGLASATDRDGPWTSITTTLYTLSDVPWEAGSTEIYAPSLTVDDGTFYLFYSIQKSSGATDAGNAIGVATSTVVTGPYTDSGAAILSPGSSGLWDSRRVGEQDVLHHDGRWIMAYMGEDSDIAYQASEQVGIATATSPTGPWTKAAANPVLPFGASGQWDDALIADPCLVFDHGYYWIWYAGGIDSAPTTRAEEGLAYALDPVAGPWVRHESNPILTVGSGGAFDDVWVFRGAIFREDGLWGGTYAAYDGANFKGGNFRLNIEAPVSAPLSDDDPTTLDFGDVADPGVADEASRADHVHGMPDASGVGELLISDTPSTPLVFADLIQNEAQDDLVYADP